MGNKNTTIEEFAGFDNLYEMSPIYNLPIYKDNSKKLHKLDMSTKQKRELDTIFKNCDDIKKEYNKVIIGGSSGLKIWTERNFNTDDVDIFLIRKNNFTSINSGNLEEDIEIIKRIYNNPEIKVNLTREKFRSVVNDDEMLEDFDRAIIGTINFTQDNIKYQFVMIESLGFINALDLVNWYGRTSDLPVFILDEYKAPEPKFIVKEGSGFLLSKLGFLTDLRHENRIKKYGEKGFNTDNKPAFDIYKQLNISNLVKELNFNTMNESQLE